MAARRWIEDAVKHPGALHRDLGVPVGTKIPIAKLRAAARRKDKVGARARLALTLAELENRKE